MRWLPRAPLALAAMMMSAADFSTTNPPGGSSTCTNSCDCHSSFSSDAPTILTQAAPRLAPDRPDLDCTYDCELISADYIPTERRLLCVVIGVVIGFVIGVDPR